jgi:hypothetical protein
MASSWLSNRQQRQSAPARTARLRHLRVRPQIELLEARVVPSFAFAGHFAVGLSPYSVAVGDFNGDGKPDLAVVNRNSNTVSVLLGNGDGTFKAAKNFAVDTDPRQVVVVDVNRDGKMDLITTNGKSNSISVLLGNGNGTFKAAQNLATGGYSNTLAVGDVNGDGKPDVVTADEAATGMVSVLLGNGNGSFQAAQNFAAGASPFGVALADFNGDGKLDLVLANNTGSSLSVLLGNGNGSFQAPQNFATALAPDSVAVADLNGDGKLDIVTANYGSPNVSVLLGNGDGTFQPAHNWAIASPSTAVAVADVNGDGKPDIVTANGTYSGHPQPYTTVSVLLGNGDGSFTAAQSFAVGKGPESVAVGDVNGDGRPDIVTANFGENTVSVLLNTAAPPATGTFSLGPTVAAPGKETYFPTIADVNGDGKPDLIVPNYDMNIVSVLLGNGDGTFQAAVNTPAGPGPSNATVADVNGDGIPDLILTYYSANEVAVLQGNGDGTFKPATQILPTGNDPRIVQVAELNGDGKPDLVVASYSSTGVMVFLGNGNGTFQAAQNLSVGSYSNSVRVADVNGDGKPDIISANFDSQPGSSGVSVLLGNGDGTFQAPQTISLTATKTFSVAVADVNGDGKPDLVAGTFSGSYPIRTGGVVVLLGNGNGTFATGLNTNLGIETFYDALADINGDGKLDLVTGNFLSGGVGVLLGRGDGTFAAPVNTVAPRPGNVRVADLNGDGRPDLLVGNFSTPAFTVLLGDRNAATHFQVIAPATTTAGGYIPITVNALTAGNQQDDVYTGTVTLTSSDGKFVSPAPYTFTLADGGSHTFFVALKTAGSKTITATDTNTSSITGKATIKVVAAAATHFKVTAPTSATAGTAFTITVTALDAYGNKATSYRGTVHFTSTDGSASLPGDYKFVAADNGKHTFSVTLKTTGSQTITVTDTKSGSITGKAKITVNAASPPPSRAATSSGGTAAAPAGAADTPNPFAMDISPAVAALALSEDVLSSALTRPAWAGGIALPRARPDAFGAAPGMAVVPSAGIVAPFEEYPARRRDIDYAFADPDGDLFGDALAAEERSGKA